jgi:hypothetical protein
MTDDQTNSILDFRSALLHDLAGAQFDRADDTVTLRANRVGNWLFERRIAPADATTSLPRKKNPSQWRRPKRRSPSSPAPRDAISAPRPPSRSPRVAANEAAPSRWIVKGQDRDHIRQSGRT